MSLTTEQQLVKEKILTHLRENETSARFDAPAGAGKTFTISHVAEDLLKEGKKIFCITSTHKALNVLKQTMMDNLKDRDVDRDALQFQTICKFLGKRIVCDENGEKSYEYKDTIKKNKKTGGYNYVNFDGKTPIDCVIIDEWSMIEDDDYKLLKRVKVPTIYLGDGCQLGPEKPVISEHVPLLCELTKIMRTDDQKLKSIYKMGRDLVLKNLKPQNFLDHILDSDDGKTVKIVESETEFINEYCKDIKSKKEPVMLDYRVAQTARYNNMIRNKLYSVPGRKCSKQYVNGEMMVFTDFYMDYWQIYLDVEDQVGESITEGMIDNPHNVMKQLSDEEIGLDMSDYTMYTQTHISIDSVMEKTLTLPFLTSPIEVFLLEYKYGSGDDKEDRFIYKPKDLDGFVKKMKMFKEEFKEMIYKKSDELDFETEFRELQETTGIIYNGFIVGNRPSPEECKDIWTFIEAITKMINAPVEFSYSITVHKAQGSTYENVYIDLRSSICWLEVPKNKKFYDYVSGKLQPSFKEPSEWTLQKNSKLIYTGVTRAKSSLIILLP